MQQSPQPLSPELQQLGNATHLEGIKAQRNEALDLVAVLNAELTVERKLHEEAKAKMTQLRELAAKFREAGRAAYDAWLNSDKDFDPDDSISKTLFGTEASNAPE